MRSGRFVLSVALAVGVAITGCSADSESSQPIETVAPVVLTATTQPTLTTTSEPTAVQIPGEGEPWDLLILMHADDLGVDVGIEYADQLSAALGVEVDMMQPIGIEPYVWMLTEHVRDRRFPGLSNLVREAEIIVLGPFPERLDEGIETYIDADSNACGFWDQPTAPDVPGVGYWDPYVEALDELFRELWSLREGAPTVLVTADTANRYVARQREAGIGESCRIWVESWSETLLDFGRRHGPTASISDVLNGPDHTIDTLEAGYTGPTDLYPVLWHGTPNEVGSLMVADALADAGYTRRTEPPVNHFRLIWDGASCTYQGATTIAPGPVGLDFVNTSEDDLLNVNLIEILDGKTIDDIVTDLGPEPSTGHAPSWTKEMGTWNYSAWGGQTNTWEGDLAPGSYAMVCARAEPFGVWFGAGLTVEE